MSGKKSEAKGQRSSNPYLELYKSKYLGGNKVTSASININYMENMIKSMLFTHEAMGKHLEDMTSGKFQS